MLKMRVRTHGGNAWSSLAKCGVYCHLRQPNVSHKSALSRDRASVPTASAVGESFWVRWHPKLSSHVIKKKKTKQNAFLLWDAQRCWDLFSKFRQSRAEWARRLPVIHSRSFSKDQRPCYVVHIVVKTGDLSRDNCVCLIYSLRLRKQQQWLQADGPSFLKVVA